MKCTQDDFRHACEELPYDRAYKFVDRVIESDGKNWIITEKHYRLEDVIVHAHRRVGGCVPGAVLIEQAAQSTLVLGMLSDPASARRIALLGQVNAKFILPVISPKTVLAEIAIKYKDQGFIGFYAEIRSENTVHAKVTGVCALMDNVVQ
jgi:3-hydroxymyristoyl/3-hydroxydecanoyl-(acyl carrier protein) dehydratase